jgi:hypothetical protein
MMTRASIDSKAQGYDSTYREFDSPLMRQLRQEAYGEDIGGPQRASPTTGQR